MNLQIWTTEEDMLIRLHYARRGREYCQRRLPNRTPAAIRQRAVILKATSRSPVNWNAEMEAKLRSMWPKDIPAEEIAKQLGTTADSVCKKAARMKLYRTAGRGRKRPPEPSRAPVKAAPCPEVPSHPFWTPPLDAKVWATQGRYERITEAAKTIGKDISYIMQRWHRLNSAAQ